MKNLKIVTTAITLSLTVVFVFSSAYARGPSPYGNTNYKIGELHQEEWKKPTDEDFLAGANPEITDAEKQYGPGGVAPEPITDAERQYGPGGVASEPITDAERQYGPGGVPPTAAETPSYSWGDIEDMEVITIAESTGQGGVSVEVKRMVKVENGKLTIVSEILPYTPIPLSFTMDLVTGNIHIVERKASQEEEFTPEDGDGYLHAVEDMITLVEYQQNKEQELDKKEILQGAIDYLKGVEAQLTPLVTELEVSIGYQTYNVAMDNENITTSSRGLARGPIINLDRKTEALSVTYYPWGENAITEVVTKDDPDRYSEFLNRAIGWVQTVLDETPSLTNGERIFLEEVKAELTGCLPITEVTANMGFQVNTIAMDYKEITVSSIGLAKRPILTLNFETATLTALEYPYQYGGFTEEVTPDSDPVKYAEYINLMVDVTQIMLDFAPSLTNGERVFLEGVKEELTRYLPDTEATYYWGGELEDMESVQITDPQRPRNFARVNVENNKFHIQFGGGTGSLSYTLDLITGFLYSYSMGGSYFYEPTDEAYGDKIVMLLDKFKEMTQMFATPEQAEDAQPAIDYLGSILKQLGYYWGDIEDMEVTVSFYLPQLKGEESITQVKVEDNQLILNYISYQLIDEKLDSDFGTFTLNLVTGNIHAEVVGPMGTIVTDISPDEKEQYKWAITSMLKRAKQAFRYVRDKYEKRELREIRKYLNNII